MISKKSLPMMFPRTNLLSPTINVPVKEVKSSGKEVTPASKIPPSNAPETFVFLSNKSTRLDNSIDKNTTSDASTAYIRVQ